MTPLLAALVHPVEVIAEVRSRLEAEGAIGELQHLARFSSAELDRLVRLERGMS